MKTIKIIIASIILLTTVGVYSQNSKSKENKEFELTISNEKKELHKTYSSFKEIQEDKAVKDMGIDINEFITYLDDSFQMATKSSTNHKIEVNTNNPSVSNEFTITKINSEGKSVMVNIKKI